MQWLTDLLLSGGGVAHTVILFSLVISLGVFLGNKVKIGGISLGVTWILFVGILVGDILKRFSVEENLEVINFVQDFVDGKISRAAFRELAKFKKPTHQISFHTSAALATLSFVREDEVHELRQQPVLCLQSDRVYRKNDQE